MRTCYIAKLGYELRHSIKFPSCLRFENSSVVKRAMSITSVNESFDDEQRCSMCLSRLGSALKRKCAICRHVGRLSSSSSIEGNAGSTKSQRQRQFFRELYQK